jgi:prophage antirepressor-like protein
MGWATGEKVNEMQIFQYEENTIRTHTSESGIVWFVVSEVCKSIGLSDSNKAMLKISAKHRDTKKVRTPSGEQGFPQIGGIPRSQNAIMRKIKCLSLLFWFKI